MGSTPDKICHSDNLHRKDNTALKPREFINMSDYKSMLSQLKEIEESSKKSLEWLDGFPQAFNGRGKCFQL